LERVARGVEMIRYLSERARRRAAASPSTTTGLVRRAGERDPDHPGPARREIGLVYNFHHGHEHIARFDALVRVMRPYLWS